MFDSFLTMMSKMHCKRIQMNTFHYQLLNIIKMLSLMILHPLLHIANVENLRISCMSLYK